MFKLGLKKIYYWLLPAFCALCHTTTENTALCKACLHELPWQQSACVRCARSLSSTGTCGQCIQNPPPYHNTICLFHYQTPIDRLILSLKFAEKLSNAKLLGDLMAEKIADHYRGQAKPEFVIPVPLHVERLRERGYNQALEIARPIAKKLQIPLETNACTRILSTLPQASTTAEERRKNMKNAFAVEALFRARHVAIVDDVLTTGSTVTELARRLKKAGVERIDVWCCARTELHFQSY